MKLGKYKEYKASGVDWLGDIPKDWEIKRVKDIGNVVLGKMLNNKPEIGYTLEFYLKSKNISWLKINLNSVEEMYFSRYEKKNYQVKNNDLLLSEGGEVGKTCIWKEELKKCYIQNSVHKISIFKNSNPRYYLYLSFSLGQIGYYDKIVNQVSIKHLTYEKLQRILWLFPSTETQTSIANYLDEKTQAIDNKITLLESKILKYKELRKSIINQAVTQGLNPNVKLKDSGISWIGNIPEHWEVKRIKDSFNIMTGNSISDKSLFENINNSLSYIATKDININTGAVDYNNGIYIPLLNKTFKRAKNHSTLICIEGASAGKKIGFINQEICFVNKLCLIKSNDNNIKDKYFYYFSQSKLFSHQFFSLLNGLIGGVSISLIKTFNILKPTIKEQNQITEYLDHKTSTIDNIIANIEQQITSLKELRKTLINDVVTGQIKVS